MRNSSSSSESHRNRTARKLFLCLKRTEKQAFDFEGATRACQAAGKVRGEYPDAQYYAIDQIAAGNMALHGGKYSEAIEHFKRVQDLGVSAKFFRCWVWPMTAQLETANAWLLSGNILNARADGDDFLESALSTADPHLQELAWDLKTRVATSKGCECLSASCG